MIPPSLLESFTLPSLANLASRDVTERAPWASSLSSNCNPKLKKPAVRKWQSDPATQHLFYSAYEGDNPTLRMSKENSPRLLRAIVVDYDCYTLSDETLNGALDDCAPDLAPSIISRSHSGGVHAIWMMEEPVWVMSPDLRKRLLDWFKKHLKLASLLPNMDDKVFHDAMIYHHAGRDWQTCDGKLVSCATIGRALMECGERASFKGSGIVVPLDVVAVELEARFPGRWQGEFVENARGCRFWEDGADALSAIVKPEGMLCYTGDKGFLDWGTLFGRAFVEKFLDDKIGTALDNRYFDGTDYWIYATTIEAWRKISREDLARKIKVRGMSGAIEKGMTFSEVDKVLDTIAEQNLVSSAAPFVQRPPGLLYLNGERHLNTASTKVVLPSDGECFEDDFPWIANFLEYSFSAPENIGHDQLLMEFVNDPQEQLWRFLAWFKRAYEAGLNFKPEQGHVLVLAGEPGCGKTLLADALVGKALGGKADATRFILGETNFNKKMFHVPCWTINDAAAATDPHRKAKYNSLVKQVAANREFTHEAKGKDAIDVAWMGRLIITCNTDPESIQVMPSMDSSMGDKILALKVWGINPDSDPDGAKEMERLKRFGLWEGRKPDENITHELPAFLRWVLAWEPPAWIERDPRFGYRAYAHPMLKEHAESVNYYAPFSEIMETFLIQWYRENNEADVWKGTATHLLAALQDEASPVRHVSKEYNSRNIGRNLSNLVSRNDGKCHKTVLDGRSIYCFRREQWVKGG